MSKLHKANEVIRNLPIITDDEIERLSAWIKTTENRKIFQQWIECIIKTARNTITEKTEELVEKIIKQIEEKWNTENKEQLWWPMNLILAWQQKEILREIWIILENIKFTAKWDVLSLRQEIYNKEKSLD